MDKRTLRLLEFDKLCETLASFAGSSMGKSLAMAVKPSPNVDWIRAAQAETTQMREMLDEGLEPPLGGLVDIRKLIKRAEIGSVLLPGEFVQILQALYCAGRMFTFLSGLDDAYGLLRTKAYKIANLRTLHSQIDTCIDETGHVRDGASPDLARLRRKIGANRDAMRGRIQQILASDSVKSYLQHSQPSVSGDRFVIAVQATHKRRIPGVVHRSSDSGQTVYIEPMELVHMGNEQAEMRDAEREEVQRILRELTAAVGELAGSIIETVEMLARIDLLCAKGKLSRTLSMIEPEVNPDGPIRLKSARHPVLELIIRNRGEDATMMPEKVVPIDVRLGENFDILVVTGPNTGGKTVALKTIGLLCLMAQCGLHVPAQRAVMPIFHTVFADIGDEQSLQQSLSTFSSHMRRIVFVLRNADRHSLVLLDELGAGTDPSEGAALGRAMLEELQSRNCLGIVTTHLGALKLHAYRSARTENACVEFDIETLRPTFRLLIGEAGESNALVIARRLGLPKHVFNRAKSFLQRTSGKLNDVISEVKRTRKHAEMQSEAADLARREAEDARRQYEQARIELEQKARKHLPPEAFLPFDVGDEVYVERFARTGKVVRIDTRKNTAIVAIGQVEAELRLDEIRESDAL